MTNSVAGGAAVNQSVAHPLTFTSWARRAWQKTAEHPRRASKIEYWPLQHYWSYCCTATVGVRTPPDHTQLYDGKGQRKYLCAEEMVRFLAATKSADARTRSFCHLLSHTGCRISEALAITKQHIDRDAKRVIFRTLKRRKVTFRAVPVSDGLMQELQRLAAPLGDEDRLWPWARQTAWRKVKAAMDAARINGAMAMPKGLRHAYGIRAASSNVPPNLIQRWLGHASPDTTALYLDAVGSEERAFAKRMW